MNNFKFFVQELRKAFNAYNDYTLDSIVVSDNDLNHSEYLIPEKVSDVKERRARANRVVMVHRNSSAYDFFHTEYRENRFSEDSYGNVLVPENDYFGSHKTR